jgi:hypothetical protein
MTTSAEFVDRAFTSAADSALFYVGTSDEKMESSLDHVRQNLEADLASPFGPDIAASIAREFVKAVAGRRREIDGVRLEVERIEKIASPNQPLSRPSSRLSRRRDDPRMGRWRLTVRY